MKAYEIEHVHYSTEEYWVIYDNIDNKYRGRYEDLQTAMEDCDLFNELWEEDQ